MDIAGPVTGVVTGRPARTGRRQRLVVAPHPGTDQPTQPAAVLTPTEDRRGGGGPADGSVKSTGSLASLCFMWRLTFAAARRFASRAGAEAERGVQAPLAVELDPVLDIAAGGARSGHESTPISVLSVAKKDSAAAPSRREPVRLVLWRMSMRLSALR